MLERTFFAIAVIVLVARCVGLVFRRFHQPQVIGEIVGGNILGPTVAGISLGHTLFPTDIRPSLSAIGQFGLVLYMFMVGLRLNVRTARANSRMVSLISLASIAVPFALAMPLAAFLLTHHRTVGGHPVDTTAFVLFVGTSLSITAFPVLARILEERRMQDTELGTIATACAAVQDVAGWCMLAVILIIASAHGSVGDVAQIALESLGFVAGAFALARLIGVVERRVSANRPEGGSDSFLLPAAVICLLACAGATEAIGLHAVFGAFVFGGLMRRHLPAAPRERMVARITPITTSTLLPIYFIIPGLSVNLRTLDSHNVIEIVLILFVACLGKIGGAFVSGRLSGLSPRQASTMGVLMNTRGLVELVVLQVGLSAGIIDPRLFSELVLMAVVTTLMTQPLLSRVLYAGAGARSEAEVGRLLALNSH
jgi:Kef-type K+ transport system membrane component KefB